MHGVVRAIAMVATLAGVSSVTCAAGKAPADLSGDWVAEIRQPSLPNQDMLYQRFSSGGRRCTRGAHVGPRERRRSAQHAEAREVLLNDGVVPTVRRIPGACGVQQHVADLGLGEFLRAHLRERRNLR